MNSRQPAYALSWIVTLSLLLGEYPSPVEAKPQQPPQLSFEGPKAPFRARRIPRTKLKPNGMGLMNLNRWPKEPDSPEELDVKRLATGIEHLCGWMPKGRSTKYAEWIAESSKEFGADPFLLAAWVYDASNCRPNHSNEAGLGLAGLSLPMHLNYIQARRYSYWVFSGTEWEKRMLDVSRYLFYEEALKRAKSSIYFAAAILRMASEQCPHNDGAFGSVPHRHFVSHAVWGDRVRGTDAEDRILIARRRLIRYYAKTPMQTERFGTLTLVSPLEGTPRKITSKMGDDRDGGRRRHKGIDFASPRGEAVRSVADGVVVLAGASLPGGGFQQVKRGNAVKWAKRRLAAAGLYVRIRHDDGLESLYMHLDDMFVARGDKVRRGQRIGVVGRTGIRASQAHLHFEFRRDGRHLDPLKIFGPLVISPMETYRGVRLDEEQRRARRGRRR